MKAEVLTFAFHISLIFKNKYVCVRFFQIIYLYTGKGRKILQDIYM